eukprot:COSAG02_NODE_4213_length_5624_cov_2.849412_2_plen_356_part_00
MRTAGPTVVVPLLLVVWASSTAPGSGGRPVLPRPAGLGSIVQEQAEIVRGSQVALVQDVTEWSGSLRHGEVGVVQSVDGSASHGFKRFLVRLPSGPEAWHEQDELTLLRTQAEQPDHDPASGGHAQTSRSGSAGTSCTLGTFYPANVTASSGSARAVELAGRVPTANVQDCDNVQAAISWLPDRGAPSGTWLQAHLGERMHIKDLTIYKTGAAGLIRRIEGFEPRYDGYKTRTLFDGVDNIACGKLLARMPSLTPWSVDRLHFAIAPASSWSARSGDVHERGGIMSIEIFGLADSCYPAFIGESIDDTKQRKRMEEGFTGCSFSGISYAEADRRIGGNPDDLIPGEGDTGTCGGL